MQPNQKHKPVTLDNLISSGLPFALCSRKTMLGIDWFLLSTRKDRTRNLYRLTESDLSDSDLFEFRQTKDSYHVCFKNEDLTVYERIGFSSFKGFIKQLRIKLNCPIPVVY